MPYRVEAMRDEAVGHLSEDPSILLSEGQFLRGGIVEAQLPQSRSHGLRASYTVRAYAGDPNTLDAMCDSTSVGCGDAPTSSGCADAPTSSGCGDASTSVGCGEDTSLEDCPPPTSTDVDCQ